MTKTGTIAITGTVIPILSIFAQKKLMIDGVIEVLSTTGADERININNLLLMAFIQHS